MNDLISVIVPAYNSADVIQKCVESVFQQSVPFWELIVVDDGSSDATLNICLELAKSEPRMKVVAKANGGVSSARNRGIYECTGNYICFIDSDDSVMPNYLETLYRPVKENNIDLSICGFLRAGKGVLKEVCLKSESVLGKRNVWMFVLENFLTWSVSSPCAKMYKRKFLPRNGFDEKISLGEDLKFNLEYIERIQSIQVVASSLYLYFDNEGSLTKTYKNGHYEGICDVYALTKSISSEKQLLDANSFKNVNYKLFSFCISFMSQNMKNTSYFQERCFIKRICNNADLQYAVKNLPKIDFVRKVYAYCICRKLIVLLHVISFMKKIVLG